MLILSFSFREEYKEVCDVQLQRKSIVKHELKQVETNELNTNHKIFQHQKKVKKKENKHNFNEFF